MIRNHGFHLPWILAGLACFLASTTIAGETITLFDGKSLDGWVVREPRERNKWVVALAQVDPNDPATLAVSSVGQAGGQLVNASTFRKGSKEKRDVDLYTSRSFSDCTLRLEFMLPQGGNSGVYMMGEYELQIKDSYGQQELTYQDLGAIYKVAVARVNPARKPGEWQTLVIDFQAPRFKDGVKVANARFIKVTINGQVIHENVELTDVTPGGLTKKEVPAGPLLLQGDHSAVAYRNIQITLPAAK